jgi:uncharacterized RDD family membrane protein YckC
MAGIRETTPTPAEDEEVRIAPYRRRLAASLIDGLLIWAASLVLVGPVLALGRLVGASAGGLLLALGAISSVLVAVAVPEARPAGRNGQSLGKQFLGMRVTHLEGHPISLARAMGRATVKWLPVPVLIVALFAAAAGRNGGAAIFWGIILVVLAAPFADSQRRAIHDRAAGTVVVEAPAEPEGAGADEVPAR